MKPIALLFVLLLTLGGCYNPPKAGATVHSGDTVDSMELLMLWGGYASNSRYAVVRADSIPAMHAAFTRVMSRQGVNGWSSRFDCVRLAGLWIAVAQGMFASGPESSGQSLALAEVWYRREGGAHAVVAARTDRGLVLIEPQTGQIRPADVEPIFVKW
jgi:hypothetical protein